MSNFIPDPHPQTSTNGVLPKLRHLSRQVNDVYHRLKPYQKATAGVLAGALVVLALHYYPTAVKQPSKKEAAPLAAVAARAVPNALPPEVAHKQNAKKSEKKHVAAGQSAETKQPSQAQNEPANSHPADTIPVPTVLSAPSAQSIKIEGEDENKETVHSRANWFFDQRAYPHKHIPSGALQKAIEQRDAMREQQRSSFKSGAT